MTVNLQQSITTGCVLDRLPDIDYYLHVSLFNQWYIEAGVEVWEVLEGCSPLRHLSSQ